MANKRNTNPTDTAGLAMRVWVVEQRRRREGCKWSMLEVVREDFPEWQLVCECEGHSQERTDYEFRYRPATLTFDDGGGKAKIY